MRYLIDAYNLMHAVGYLTPATPLNRMESSRRRLIDWLVGHARTHPADSFHVVFDAKTAPKPSPDSVINGISVSFAFQESADDFLERLLTRATGPTTLVTNDTIIQAAAKSCQIPFLACSAFVDVMLTVKAVTNQPRPPVDKPIQKSNDDDLLAVFSQPIGTPTRPKR